jgi:hypothetical protein
LPDGRIEVSAKQEGTIFSRRQHEGSALFETGTKLIAKSWQFPKAQLLEVHGAKPEVLLELDLQQADRVNLPNR